MTRICNFPTTRGKRCKQPITDDRPNCGRHECEIPSEQLGQGSTVYRKNGELHVWAGKPDDVYCLIHSDPVYQVLYQVAGEVPPCCLDWFTVRKDENGKWHRDDGPAAIWPDGTQQWYQHGKHHRENGPAKIWPDGSQEWWQHNELHRDDGPAKIEADGTQHWFWHGKWVTKEEHARLREQSRGT